MDHDDRNGSVNPLSRQHTTKRNYSTMAEGHRRPHNETPSFDHPSSSLFIPEDEHYDDNENPTRRPRLTLPPIRFPGDGLDFRRPASSARPLVGPQSNVIDLTEDDEPYQAPRHEERHAAESSRHERPPRYERGVLDHGAAQGSDGRRAERRAERGGDFVHSPADLRAHVLALQHRNQTRRDAETQDNDEIEVVMVRPRSRPQSTSRRHTPSTSNSRSGTPRDTDHDEPIDLTEDDDVIITEERRREGGVNAARPGITAGLGTRSMAETGYHAIAAIFRQNAVQEGSPLHTFVARRQRMTVEEMMHRGMTALYGGNEAQRRFTNVPGEIRLDHDIVGFDMGMQRPASPQYEAPKAPGRGFTRNPGEDEEVVCPSCGDELAMGDNDMKQQIWVIKTCGHAYCGECAETRPGGKISMSKKGKSRALDSHSSPPLKRCVVMGCGEKNLSKASMARAFFGGGED